MKSVLVSLKPYYYYLVGEGIKEIEVRKNMPRASDWNKEVLVYMSKDVKSFAKIPKELRGKYRKHFGKVGMQIVCNEVYEWKYDYCDGVDIDDDLILDTCLDREDINIYAKGKTLYGWHISDLKIYDKPKELSEFRPICKFDGKDAICALFCPNWKYDGGLFFECTRKVTRPPQSYMYVEEL